MTTRVIDIIPASGNHASRPATAPDGSLYSCTTHNLLYRYTTAGGWVTWATLSAGGSVVTTKGDLFTYDTGNARLPVGTNGQVLTADSTQATGIKWAAAAGGGGTHSYLGTNSVGGTWEALAGLKVYAKKITISSAGTMLSIDAHLRQSGGSAGETRAGLYTDSSGTPGVLIAQTAPGMTYLATTGPTTAGRWMTMPVGAYLTAADYWIAVFCNAVAHDIAVVTTGGGDRTYVSNTNAQADWGFFSPTTTTKDYSIRASMLT